MAIPVKNGAPWAIIAVMGVTGGAGKSTFIRTVSGDESVVVGDSLESCTSDLKGYSFHYNGYNINLIDTPGFNDTFRSETQVLQDISAWLRDQYEMQNKLAGIIYLHGINHSRVEGSALRNLKMFRELCGQEALKNIVLATTFWTGVDPSTGQAREHELATKETFWAGMLESGARMTRFVDRASGLELLRDLVGSAPIPLKIQKELVEDDKALVDTNAGKVVNEELVRLEEKHKKELNQLQIDMKEAMNDKDVEYQKILRGQEEKLLERMSRVQRQQEQLKADRRAEARRMQGDFEAAISALRNKKDLEVSDLQTDVRRLQETVRQREHEYGTTVGQLEERISELKLYNEQARKKFESLDIDGMIAHVRTEESKLRVEDREKLEAQIQTMQQISSPRKRDMLPEIFLDVLRATLPVATLLALGVPVTLPL